MCGDQWIYPQRKLASRNVLALRLAPVVLPGNNTVPSLGSARKYGSG